MRQSNNSHTKIIIIIIVIISCFVLKTTTNDIAFNLYLRKLEQYAKITFIHNQKLWLNESYHNICNKKYTKSYNKRIRKQFNKHRHNIRNQWSDIYLTPWPKANNSTQYQAHHIIPISNGGKNHVYNIIPLSVQDHNKIHKSIEMQACFGGMRTIMYRILLFISILVTRYIQHTSLMNN